MNGLPGRRVSKAIHHQGIRVVGADDMLHTATAYHGRTLEGKRRAAVFFWMAKA